MGQIWVKEFTGGLDSRRMPETTAGGILIKATDGHITRGGEFEKRAAFVPQYALLAGTVSMAYTRTGIVVFGHLAAPGGLPLGIAYQRLQHPTPATALLRVASFDLYAGKIYAVGLFADGTIHHFYDGVRVTDWFDGRARASFQVTGGGVFPAVSATGTVTITGGTSGAGNAVTAVTVNGVAITNASVLHTGDNATTATALANNINSFVSTPDYTAVAVGNSVTITAVTAGTGPNGFVVATALTGDVTTTTANMAGGVAAITSQLNNLTINGVAVIGAGVNWATSNDATASAIAAAITAYASSPEYTALAVGNQVVIQASTTGTGPNGFVVTPTVSGGLALTPSSTTMQGGSATTGTFVPGLFVRTIGSKMYSTSGPNLHFSGIQQPTKWTTATTGAGFIDMSTEASGSEELTAVAKYQNFIAVFSEENIQVWYVDPNPTLNKASQLLNNTGTGSAKSVTQFGDDDLFYYNTSGLRSLRARDASNSASTTDIGSPVDTLINEAVATLTDDERDNIIGIIEPREGRFWLAVKDKIFVFSYFSGANVSAWSMYLPGFNIEDMVVYKRRVYLRSGNTIYVYGGLEAALAYDSTVAIAQLPYLDGDKPTMKKHFTGYDAAARGLWEVSIGMDPNNEDAIDVLGTIFQTTFDAETLPAQGAHTHFSLLFKSQGNGYAKLGSAVMLYDGDDDDD
jgi:hypothetical protein